MLFFRNFNKYCDYENINHYESGASGTNKRRTWVVKGELPAWADVREYCKRTILNKPSYIKRRCTASPVLLSSTAAIMYIWSVNNSLSLPSCYLYTHVESLAWPLHQQLHRKHIPDWIDGRKRRSNWLNARTFRYISH